MRHLFTTAVLLLLLVFPCLVMAASWKQLDEDTFIDEDTIVRDGNNVTFFTKYIIQKDLAEEIQRKYRYSGLPEKSLSKCTYHCGKRTFSTHSVVMYSYTGNVIHSISPRDGEKDILPGSVGENTYKYVCGQR